jgi:hypothetical protein
MDKNERRLRQTFLIQAQILAELNELRHAAVLA